MGAVQSRLPAVTYWGICATNKSEPLQRSDGFTVLMYDNNRPVNHNRRPYDHRRTIYVPSCRSTCNARYTYGG